MSGDFSGSWVQQHRRIRDEIATNEYHFISRWRVEPNFEEVYRLLSDPLGFPRRWPWVYLEVKEVQLGDPNGLGKIVRLHTKGLPYTLRWQSRVSQVDFPNGFGFEATGDFVGHCLWSFRQDGRHADMTFNWKIRADKPLLRLLSFVLKPVFSANHRWAMSQGEKCLRAELAKRVHTSEARA